MNLLTIGLNHKTCPLDIRERLAFSKEGLPQALKQLKETVFASEVFLLSTCNRVEAVFVTTDISKTQQEFIRFLSSFHDIKDEAFRVHLYNYENRNAVEHLFKVVCGLDSLVFGENEIHGQVKDAYKQANSLGVLSSVLSRLIERAFQVAKQIKTETKINEGATSVSSVAVELAEKIFGKLNGEKVLVIGSGQMSELTLKHLVDSGAGGVLIANRTLEKSQSLASLFNAQAIPFEEIHSELTDVDIVISQTASAEPILTVNQIEQVIKLRRQKPLFLIDIAVPRDIDSEVSKIDDIYLYNIDDLKIVAEKNLKQRTKEIEVCEKIIQQKTEEFFKWMSSLEVGPIISRFKDYVDDCLREELKDDADSDEELEELVHRLRGKIMHLPMKKLKDSALNGSTQRYLEALDAFFDLRNSEMIREEIKKQKKVLGSEF